MKIKIVRFIKDVLKSLLEIPKLPLALMAIHNAKKAAKLDRENKQVVFVANRFHGRLIKLAEGLRSIGWKVILICSAMPPYEINSHFYRVHTYRSNWEALRLAASYAPVAYHLFCNWDFRVAETIVRYRPGKTVFDGMDLVTGMVKDEVIRKFNFSRQMKAEQYCLMNADALCCRDLRTQHLKKNLGYKLPQRVLFPEYAWGTNNWNGNKLTDGIHVVYAGNLELDPESPTAFQYKLAALLSEEGIHFHIYPSVPQLVPELEKRFAGSMDNNAYKQFIHVHDTVPPEHLVAELSRYHYGIMISSKDINHRVHDTYYEHNNEYFIAGKIFDYLDAGLFILTQNGKVVKHMLVHNQNGAIVHTLEDIVKICKSRLYAKIAIPDNQKLSTNIGRLASFYENI